VSWIEIDVIVLDCIVGLAVLARLHWRWLP
jgi:hypothetical protein